MNIKKTVFFLVLSFLFLSSSPAHAIIIISEVLADPAGDISGDANQDGVVSSFQDEFIEILNMADFEADLSGWSIRDAIKTRHVFGSDTVLLPYEFFVVFGGGNPAFPGASFWQVASSGGLGLNNSGDQIVISDLSGVAVSEANYGSEGGNNQSLVKFPETTASEFVLHSSVPEAQGRLFSPGTMANGEIIEPSAVSAVPEAGTLLCVALGCVGMVLGRKRYINT